ncbi:amino acid permease [Candidatus Dependentiae bacterium]|nr:amino acid permease [Candidatus Dependentiae bacterium]
MQTKNQPKIGLLTATVISMNAMIGAGIFTTPANLAHTVGPAGILTYAFVIVAVLCMALSLSWLAERYPQEGSFYTYAKQWGGHTVGVIAASSYALGVSIAMGLIAKMAANYLHVYIPSISTTFLGTGLIALITLLNVSGVRFMQVGQFVLLGCTLFALLSTTLLGFFNADTSNLTPFMPQGFSSVLSATSTAIFAFFGFESAASLFNIVQNPQRNVPKALVGSIVVVGGIYLAFISSILLSIPSNFFPTSTTSVAQALIEKFPQYSWLGNAIGIAILTALLGVLQSMHYSVSSLILSFSKFLHNKTLRNFAHSPNSFKIIVIALGTFIFLNFIAIDSMGLFFNLVSLLIVFAFAASMLTLIIKPNRLSAGQKAIVGLGLITAVLIFGVAFSGVISALR